MDVARQTRRAGIALIAACAFPLCAQSTYISPSMDHSGTCAQDKFGKQPGNVTVGLTIDATGQPLDVQVLKADFDDLIPCAVEIVQNSHFHPAMRNGKPVPAHIQMQIHVEMK